MDFLTWVLIAAIVLLVGVHAVLRALRGPGAASAPGKTRRAPVWAAAEEPTASRVMGQPLMIGLLLCYLCAGCASATSPCLHPYSAFPLVTAFMAALAFGVFGAFAPGPTSVVTLLFTIGVALWEIYSNLRVGCGMAACTSMASTSIGMLGGWLGGALVGYVVSSPSAKLAAGGFGGAFGFVIGISQAGPFCASLP